MGRDWRAPPGTAPSSSGKAERNLKSNLTTSPSHFQKTDGRLLAPAMGDTRDSEDGAPPAPALLRDHTRFLICSTTKLVPFLASPQRNFEHRHRQPEAGRI